MNKIPAPADVPPLLTEGDALMLAEYFQMAGYSAKNYHTLAALEALASGRVGVYDKAEYRLVAVADPKEEKTLTVGSEAAASSSASSASRLDDSGSVLDRVLDEFWRRTKEVPLGHDNIQRGRSTYSWRSAILRELYEIAGSRDASGSADPEGACSKPSGG